MVSGFSPFRLGRYDCLELLGVGPYTSVYRGRVASRPGFVVDYAVKKLHDRYAAVSGIRERFLAALARMAALQDSNVVRVLDAGEDGRRVFGVTELVNGVTLAQVLEELRRRGTRMPWDLAVHVASGVAKALQGGHATRGPDGLPFVHGNLGPTNVMLTWRGEVKVLDFGLGLQLFGGLEEESSAIFEKWRYLAPEQVAGARPSEASDLFALGALLYELLAGRPAFSGEDREDILASVRRAQVEPIPDVDPLLEPILSKLLEVEPAARYETASEVREALLQVLLVRGRLVREEDLALFLERLSEGEEFAAAGDSGIRQALEVGGWQGVDTEEVSTLPRRGEGSQELTDVDTNLYQPGLRGRLSDSVHEPATRAETPARLREMLRVGRKPETLPPVPAPATPPEVTIPPAEFSSTNPEYALVSQHFVPRLGALETSPVEVQAGMESAWTARHVLILVLAILTMVVATAALVIAYFRQRRVFQGPPRAPLAVRRTVRDASVADGASFLQGAEPSARDAGDAAGRSDGGPWAIGERPRVARRVGPKPQVEDGVRIESVPSGAQVVCNGRLAGRTPMVLRFHGERRCELVLNKELRRPVRRVLTRERWEGRRLKVYLPWVRGRAKKARRGTSVQVLCRGPGVYRVYLNGRDSGWNCPVRLRVPPGRNDVGLYLSRGKRVYYRRFTVRGGQTYVVEWEAKGRADKGGAP